MKFPIAVRLTAAAALMGMMLGSGAIADERPAAKSRKKENSKAAEPEQRQDRTDRQERPERERGPKGNPFSVEALRETLGLNDAQAEKMRIAVRDFEKEQVRRNADIQIAQLELQESLELAAPDLAQLETKIRQVAALESGLRFYRFKTMWGAKEFLKPEQFEKLREMVQRTIQQPGGGPRGGAGAGQNREGRPDREE